jgi:DNA-binding winged helix-turn-helix (wHTH) protein
LRAAIWGVDTFVDFERGLNFCTAQIRSALGDSAESPRFIETLPRRGYRFIAPVKLPRVNGRAGEPVNPAGAEAVRIRFEPAAGQATSVTVEDGATVVKAMRTAS